MSVTIAPGVLRFLRSEGRGVMNLERTLVHIRLEEHENNHARNRNV
jgi:hypothetical protein